MIYVYMNYKNDFFGSKIYSSMTYSTVWVEKNIFLRKYTDVYQKPVPIFEWITATSGLNVQPSFIALQA